MPQEIDLNGINSNFKNKFNYQILNYLKICFKYPKNPVLFEKSGTFFEEKFASRI